MLGVGMQNRGLGRGAVMTWMGPLALGCAGLYRGDGCIIRSMEGKEAYIHTSNCINGTFS